LSARDALKTTRAPEGPCRSSTRALAKTFSGTFIKTPPRTTAAQPHVPRVWSSALATSPRTPNGRRDSRAAASASAEANLFDAP